MLFRSLAPEFIVRLFSRSEEVVPLSKDYLVIVCLSYLFTGISYMLANALRSVGSAYLPMLVSLFAVLTNTGLNYLLIFGKGGFPVLGVRGAAIATLIARLVETLLLLILTFRPRSPFAGKAGEYLRYGKAFAHKASSFNTILTFNRTSACLLILTSGKAIVPVSPGEIGRAHV